MTPEPAVFLDRDGTLNVRPPAHEYVRTAAGFRWLPGAREGVARLAALGYVPVVVSNQRGIARGLVRPETLGEIEARIQADLAGHGCRVASFRYCPHEIDAGCPCRKPRPGLLLQAAAEMGLDLAASWMIGDDESDVEAGRAAGCRTLLLGPGGSAADLREAAEIVARSPGAIRR